MSAQAPSLEHVLGAPLPLLSGDRTAARGICRLREHAVCRSGGCLVSSAAGD